MIEKLFVAGVDVFRINMSHSSFDMVRGLHAAIRGTEAKHGRPIGILADLQGPKFRVGKLGGDRVELTTGQTYIFDTKEQDGDDKRVFLPHAQIFEGIEPGHTLLLDDGKVRLTAVEALPERIVTRVEVAGKLSDRKGVSFTDSTVP
jgi:pyruvate kinase